MKVDPGLCSMWAVWLWLWSIYAAMCCVLALLTRQAGDSAALARCLIATAAALLRGPVLCYAVLAGRVAAEAARGRDDGWVSSCLTQPGTGNRTARSGGHPPRFFGGGGFALLNIPTKRVVVSWWWHPCWLQPQRATQPWKQRVLIDTGTVKRPKTLEGPQSEQNSVLPSLPSHFSLDNQLGPPRPSQCCWSWSQQWYQQRVASGCPRP